MRKIIKLNAYFELPSKIKIDYNINKINYINCKKTTLVYCQLDSLIKEINVIINIHNK